MNILLCGPAFSGKTTFGQIAAQKLEWTFLDTDRLLEQCYASNKERSLTCREIYRNEGEQIFRIYEKRALASLTGCKNCVIALGGGTLSQLENIRLLKNLGTLLYLKTPVEDLQKRLLASTLPSYLEDEVDPLAAFRKLIQDRAAIFERYADKIVDTKGLEDGEVLLEILNTINKTKH